jgi:transposase-like protein DUF772
MVASVEGSGCASRTPVDTILVELSPEFAKLYSPVWRPSIPLEKLLRALLLQVLYSTRSERLLMEQLDYNLLFRWFVGLNCGRGSWGGRRLSLADYVTGTDAHARGVLVLLPLEPGGLGPRPVRACSPRPG